MLKMQHLYIQNPIIEFLLNNLEIMIRWTNVNNSRGQNEKNIDLF